MSLYSRMMVVEPDRSLSEASTIKIITNLLKVFLTMLAAQLCRVITSLQIVTSQQLSDEILCPKNESC